MSAEFSNFAKKIKMGKYQLSHKEIMRRLCTLVPGSALDSGDGLCIPLLKVAIVVEDWGPNQYDRFSMFHFSDCGLDRTLLSKTFIPVEHNDPALYVATFCMPILIEHYEGRYIDDIEIPAICMKYWNQMLRDSHAEASFRPKNR